MPGGAFKLAGAVLLPPRAHGLFRGGAAVANHHPGAGVVGLLRVRRVELEAADERVEDPVGLRLGRDADVGGDASAVVEAERAEARGQPRVLELRLRSAEQLLLA